MLTAALIRPETPYLERIPENKQEIFNNHSRMNGHTRSRRMLAPTESWEIRTGRRVSDARNGVKLATQ
ncbi:hypothetical protein FQZ97_1250670 [compost metagenome]